LPARVRGRRRPRRQEAVAAAGDPRLHALPGPDRWRGRRRARLRRLQPAQVDEAVQGPGAEAAGARREHRLRRRAAQVVRRRGERKGDKLVNTTLKVYPNVSQFWTYDEKWFLAQPVYSRDYPPLKS